MELYQQDYAKKVLMKFSMQGENLVTAPFVSHFKISKAQSPKINKEIAKMQRVPYAFIVCILMYTMLCT